MSRTYKIALVGAGKIARDQHIPAIRASGRFHLAAAVDPAGGAGLQVPAYARLAEMVQAHPEIEALAVCTPPGVRPAVVAEAFAAGRHVLIEKPPASTITGFEAMVAAGRRARRVLYQAWHSQHNDAVEATRRLLRAEGVAEARIDWRESVRKWHPGQDWVWQPGGFGVCDPGINALSILTRILPFSVRVTTATLRYPANRKTPVGAEIALAPDGGAPVPIGAAFDWLEEAGEVWTIAIRTGTGRQLRLEAGGRRLVVDGRTMRENADMEYEAIYKRFAACLDRGRSEVDAAPFRLMADVFMLGARETVAPFDW